MGNFVIISLTGIPLLELSFDHTYRKDISKSGISPYIQHHEKKCMKKLFCLEFQTKL